MIINNITKMGIAIGVTGLASTAVALSPLLLGVASSVILVSGSCFTLTGAFFIIYSQYATAPAVTGHTAQPDDFAPQSPYPTDVPNLVGNVIESIHAVFDNRAPVCLGQTPTQGQKRLISVKPAGQMGRELLMNVIFQKIFGSSSNQHASSGVTLEDLTTGEKLPAYNTGENQQLLQQVLAGAAGVYTEGQLGPFYSAFLVNQGAFLNKVYASNDFSMKKIFTMVKTEKELQQLLEVIAALAVSRYASTNVSFNECFTAVDFTRILVQNKRLPNNSELQRLFERGTGIGSHTLGSLLKDSSARDALNLSSAKMKKVEGWVNEGQEEAYQNIMMGAMGATAIATSIALWGGCFPAVSKEFGSFVIGGTASQSLMPNIFQPNSQLQFENLQNKTNKTQLNKEEIKAQSRKSCYDGVLVQGGNMAGYYGFQQLSALVIPEKLSLREAGKVAAYTAVTAAAAAPMGAAVVGLTALGVFVSGVNLLKKTS